MNFLRLTIIVIFCCLLFACEKIVEVDIDNNETKYFVEAYVFDEPANNVVRVTKTQSVFDDEPSQSIADATVTIEEDGKLHSLNYTPAGFYNNKELLGKEGSTYELKVEVDGQTFTATSKMPNKATYDDIIMALPFPVTANGDTISPCEEGIFFAFNQFTDIPGEKNFYMFDYNRFETTGNTAQSSTDEQIYIQDDIFNDDITSCIPFFNTCFVEGQELKTIMYNITEVMYNYYYVLAAVANNGTPGGDVTPQNPTTNIEGGALGFFNTAAITRKNTMIKSSPIGFDNPCN